jgi:homoserine dehydrogenase
MSAGRIRPTTQVTAHPATADQRPAYADAAIRNTSSSSAAAYKHGEKLRFIARLDAEGPQPRARVGLESLPGDDPLATGAGNDNRVAIWSDRYAAQPLVIQGPGAGAGVTAAALLDDVLRIAASA